ncbi:MAG: PTS sugar transporter subunit IIC [Bradymonadia bacterium]
MLVEVSLVSLYTGCLCLDRRAVGQTMVSQPLVAVAGLGWWFGYLELSLIMGSILQLLWMGSSLYGANIPQNETLASATAAGSLFISMRYGYAQHEASWILAVMFTAPTAFLCKKAQEWLDRYSSGFSQKADERVAKTSPARLGSLVLMSLLAAFLVHTLIAFAAIFVTLGGLYMLEGVHAMYLVESLGLVAWFILPSLALAVSIALIRRRLHLVFFVAAFVVVVGLLHNVRGGL